jgi:hypothetical protein
LSEHKRPNLNHYDELVERLRHIVAHWNAGDFDREACGHQQAQALLARLPNQAKARPADLTKETT